MTPYLQCPNDAFLRTKQTILVQIIAVFLYSYGSTVIIICVFGRFILGKGEISLAVPTLGNI